MQKLSLAALALPMFLITACGEDMSSSETSGLVPGVLVRSAAGWNAQAIEKAVNDYRKDLGGDNNLNTAGTQLQGHREINWDGVPAAISSPNNFPGATFKNRGLLISSPGVKLQVSTNQAEAAQAAPLFGNLNKKFPELFNTFSPAKLFAPVDSTVTELTFTVPGSDTKATVKGFGAVFTDVDVANLSKMEYYDSRGAKIHVERIKAVPGRQKSLSFAGVTFTNGKSIAKVVIRSGNLKLNAYTPESAWNDAVAMDDFLYGEPKALPEW